MKNRSLIKPRHRKEISKWFLWIIFIFLTPRLFAYYDSLQGRFLSPDPGGYEASLGLNDYGSGDPVNQLDSDGRFVRPVLDLADQYQAGTRFVGTLQLAGGTAMAVVGTPMLGTPAFPLGAALIGLGGDQAQAGLRTMLYGQPSESFLYQGSEALGMSPYQARIFEGGMTLAGGYSGLRGVTVLGMDAVVAGGIEEETLILYRGVKAKHTFFKEALEGTAQPYGGHSDPLLHNRGDTRSIFTSWSLKESKARESAHPNGVILRIEIRSSDPRIHQSIDRYSEMEILLEGRIEGAKVKRPFGSWRYGE